MASTTTVAPPVAMLAKVLPLRTSDQASTPRLLNGHVGGAVETGSPGLASRRRRPSGQTASMLKARSLLDIVDEERVGTEYESEWEKSGEYGRRAMQCGENISKLQYFFNISSPLDVVWSHATNSRLKLERALGPGSRVMILEADVSWGSSGNLKEVSIMAHPPNRSSDLTFADFCRRVCKHNHDVEAYRRVGVKFDFKDARCVVPCLTLLRDLAGDAETVGWPVFLNADVWTGPGGNPPKILPQDFFGACFDLYPAGTLSPGWTCWLKFDGPSDAASRLLDPMLLEGYNLQHVEDALRTLPRGVGHVTFPVHCTMARVGSEAILKLLNVDHRFTLTLWGEAMPADDEWMYTTPELKGRVFRDCAKPGVLSYGLTVIPLLFQQATRSLALTALGGAVALTRKSDLLEGRAGAGAGERGGESPPSAEAHRAQAPEVAASEEHRGGGDLAIRQSGRGRGEADGAGADAGGSGGGRRSLANSRSCRPECREDQDAEGAGGSEGAAGSGEGLSISRASSTDRQRAAVPAFEGGGVLQASAHATLCGTLDVEEADSSVQ